MPPRVRVLYLLVVAVGVFALRDPAWLGAVAGAQVAAWLALRHPPLQILRLARRLATLLFFVVLSFVVFPPEGDPRAVTLGGVEVSLLGLEAGATMALRIFTVILVSDLIRRGTAPGTFVTGLRGLYVPESVAAAIDATLHLLGDADASPHRSGRGGGHGGGGGRGRGRGDGGGHGGGRGGGSGGGSGGMHAEAPGPAAGFPLRRILRGDVGFFVDEIEQSLDRAQAYVRRASPHLSSQQARDLGVVSGITLTMMSLKMLKVLPGLPFAPGHKTVLLLPLYILASQLTQHRWGATLVGTSMGVLGFLSGDGRYGVFEILKHVAPGVIIDLLAPFVRGKAGLAGALRYGLVGLAAAFGRFASIVAMTALMGAPVGFYAMAAPLGLVHLGFGAASGAVTFALMRSYDRIRTRVSQGAPPELDPGDSGEESGPRQPGPDPSGDPPP